MKKVLNLIVYLASASAAFSVNVATDNAANSVYSDGWATGDNGGSGFGAWTITSSPNGGFSGTFIGNSVAGPANPDFGIYSGGNSNASLLARRPFTGGAMAVGDRFSVNLAHTQTINGQIGLSLLSGTTSRWTLKFVGGGTNWLINDGGSDFSSGQAYAADTSLSFSFTYNGGSSYSYVFGAGSGNNYTATADISNIDGVQFFSTNQGADQNMTFNNLAVPEPSSASLLTFALSGLLALRRRKA